MNDFNLDNPTSMTGQTDSTNLSDAPGAIGTVDEVDELDTLDALDDESEAVSKPDELPHLEAFEGDTSLDLAVANRKQRSHDQNEIAVCVVCGLPGTPGLPCVECGGDVSTVEIDPLADTTSLEVSDELLDPLDPQGMYDADLLAEIAKEDLTTEDPVTEDAVATDETL
ncbi:MAG: hypothetical protein CEO22_690 [Candidatus Berkelbacteria bacterium Gr01-1014_85]|uniref:Uncharacterized protein n=1 Tax=Candidatus Berkelbacteria bacterium Gr01-1014_85 TaxID=2017150 RepID=A0A554J932_9BACT|nr:MAG: hypothetical protein CEO22_690 [Candidatus Berkelbacteria bacterium Gr01-1014_85]